MYRQRDVENVLRIKRLLYDQGYTIAGARQHLRAEAKPAQLQSGLPFPKKGGPESLKKVRQGLEEILGILKKKRTSVRRPASDEDPVGRVRLAATGGGLNSGASASVHRLRPSKPQPAQGAISFSDAVRCDADLFRLVWPACASSLQEHVPHCVGHTLQSDVRPCSGSRTRPRRSWSMGDHFATYGAHWLQPLRTRHKLVAAAIGPGTRSRKTLPHPAFVMINGDLLAHSFPSTYRNATHDANREDYRAFVRKTVEFLALELRKRFSGYENSADTRQQR